MLRWIFQKLLMIAIWIAAKAQKGPLGAGEVLQVKFGIRTKKGFYEGILFLVDANVVQMHSGIVNQLDADEKPVDKQKLN